MKIAINKFGDSFTERWISYCQEHNIDFKIVDSYQSDIVEQVDDCDVFMWHHSHMDSKDVLFANKLLFALESAGKTVFPGFNDNWHFDDKVAQKYLFEALKIDAVPAYVFYTRQTALEWADKTTFPKVFKLRGGSGSSNVRLIKSKSDAKKVIKKAFSKGFSQYDSISNLKERYRKYRLGKAPLKSVLKGFVRLGYTTNLARIKGNEVGYVYFQDFIEANDSDFRVIVIEDKAFAIKRMVRENDFRASGGGNLIYGKHEFADKLISTSFKIAKTLKSNCVAFDFVVKNGEYLLIEISYGFKAKGYDPCEGYWDTDIKFHEGQINPQGWMIESVINSVKKKKA